MLSSTGSQREYTNIYRLFYLSPGQNTAHVVAEDQKRFLAMETLIFHLYSIFGNGVLNGWEIREELSGLNLIITAGSGHIGFKSAMTISDTPVELPITTNTIIGEEGLKFYIYAKETEYTSIDRSVNFFASTNLIPISDPNFDVENLGLEEVGPCGIIGIGEVVVKEIEVNGVTTFTIEKPTYETRDTLGIFASLDRYIKNHLHVGGANQPSKINLYRHVMGKLSGRHIEWINASLIKKGKISNDRLPAFDHNELMNIGILSHSEIDTLLELVVNKMNGEDKHALGDIAIANLLKLLTFLKHQYLEIDDILINTIVYIPIAELMGLVDTEHTTATIDIIEEEIQGVQASNMGSDTVSWNTKEEFEAVRNEDINRSHNIVITEEGVSLNVPLNLSIVYSTTTMNAEDWITIITDLENNTSVIHNEEDGDINFSMDGNAGIFAIKYFLDASSQYRQAQSWDGSTKLEFSIKLEANEESEIRYSHGNIFFFLIGRSPIANPVYEGYIDQSIPNPNGGSDIPINPGVVVLANDEYTDGYKHIRIEIDDNNFNPSNVQGIGFYTTLDAGWDGRYNFNFQINQPNYSEMIPQVSNYLGQYDSSGFIDIYRYNDIYYNNYGDIIFVYTANQEVFWDNISYDVTLPSVEKGESPSIVIKTSVGDSEFEALNGKFTTIDPYDGSINQDNSEYIAIWVQLYGGGETDKKIVSPILHSLRLFYSISSGDFSQQEWVDYDDWFNRTNGYTNIEIINEDIDYIKIENSSYVNSIYFIEKNSIKTINENKLDISNLGSSGENMPLSPIQSFYNLGNGFLEPKQVTKLTNSGYLIADTGNDRIVEVNSNFIPVRIIQGNTYLSLVDKDLAWLTTTYNEELGQLALTFSQRIDLSNFDLTKIVLTCGSNVLNLGNTLNARAFMFGGALAAGSNINSNGLWSTDSTYIPHIGTIQSDDKQSDISGEILLFNLTTTAKIQVNNWVGEKRVILNNNAYSSNINFSSATNIAAPSIFDRNNEDFVNFGDYNNDGYITGVSKLYGEGGDNSSILEMVVDEVNIVYWDILAPCSVEIYNNYAYLISQPNRFSIVNLRYTGIPIWTIKDDMVRFAFYTSKGNKAYGGTKIIDIEEDRMLIISPVNNIVFEMLPTSNAILNYKSTSPLTAVDAYKIDTGETIVLVSDESALGVNSRVYIEDNKNDVIFEWGLGKLRLPTGLQILENGNILISC